MRVIQAPPKFHPFRFTCSFCGAELEAETPDDFVRFQGYDQRDGDGWDYASAKCLCCSSSVKVAKEKFPPHIYAKLKLSK